MTPKQAAFVLEYLVDLNATQAAIRAGYSEHTAGSQGQRLLTKVDIQDSISAAQAERAERTGLDAAFVLNGLQREAQAGDTGEPNTARIRAMELLGKHLGMFADRLKVEDETQGPREVRITLVEPPGAVESSDAETSPNPQEPESP